MATATEAASPLEDHLIVPGERVGFITKETTEEALTHILPATHIRRVWVDMGEGEYSCSTEIFPDSEQSLTITWANSLAENEEECMAMAAPSQALSIIPATGYWRTKEGIGIGSSLTHLEKANGAPVSFIACECCGDGGVLTLHEGHLSGYRYKEYGYIKMADGVHHDASPVLALFLNYRFAVSTETIAPYQKVGGIISTDLPLPIKNMIRIDKMIIYLEKDAPLPPA